MLFIAEAFEFHTEIYAFLLHCIRAMKNKFLQLNEAQILARVKCRIFYLNLIKNEKKMLTHCIHFNKYCACECEVRAVKE